MVLFKNVPYLFLCSIHLYHQPFSLLQTKVLHKYIAYIMIIWILDVSFTIPSLSFLKTLMVIIVLPSLTSVTVSVRMVTILPFSIIVSVRIFCFLLENLKNEEEDEDEEDEDDDEDEEDEDEDVCFFTNPSKNLEQVTHMDPKEPEEDPNVEA